MNKKEFLLLSKMYTVTVYNAEELIEKMLKEDREVRGFKHGSCLTAHLKRHLEEATEGINHLTEKDEFGLTKVALNEDGGILYDKKDAYKMLQAIDKINTYVL